MSLRGYFILILCTQLMGGCSRDPLALSTDEKLALETFRSLPHGQRERLAGQLILIFGNRSKGLRAKEVQKLFGQPDRVETTGSESAYFYEVAERRELVFTFSGGVCDEMGILGHQHPIIEKVPDESHPTS